MIGQGQALTFQTADRRLYSPQQQQQAEINPNSRDYGFGDPLSGLQDVELPDGRNLTKEYYQKAAILKGFMHKMASMGLDVTRPDLTNPDSIDAHDAFLEQLSELQHTGDQLKSGAARKGVFDQLEALGQVRRREGFNPNAQPFGEVDVAENYAPTALDPLTQEANRRLSQTRYTNRDVAQANEQIYDPTVQALDQTAREGATFAEREQARRSLEAVNPALLTTDHIANRQQDLLAKKNQLGKKTSRAVSLYKQLVNLSRGEGSFEVSAIPVDGANRYYLESKEFTGKSTGDATVMNDKGQPIKIKKVIKNWLHDPETGQTFIEFTDRRIPKEELTGRSMNAFAATLFEDNPSLGARADKLYSELEDLEALDQYGEAIDDIFAGQDTTEKRREKQAEYTFSYDPMDEVDNLPPTPGYFTDRTFATVELKNGVIAEVKRSRKNEDRYEIANSSKVPGLKKWMDDNNVTDFSREELRKFFVNSGAYEVVRKKVEPKEDKEYTIQGKKYTRQQIVEMGYTEEEIEQAIKEGIIK